MFWRLYRTGMSRPWQTGLRAGGLIQFDDLYEPLNERPPRGVWRVAQPIWGLEPDPPAWIGEVIAGFGEFLAAADIERLTDHLAADATAVRDVSLPCRVWLSDRPGGGVTIRFDCNGELSERSPLKGRLRVDSDGELAGIVYRLHPDPASQVEAGLVARGGPLERTEHGWRARFALRDTITGLDARMADGNLVKGLSLTWPAAGHEKEVRAEQEAWAGQERRAGRPVDATLTVSVADDFAAVIAAVDDLAAATLAGDSDALADAPFRRVAVLRPIFDRLGLASLDWCCLDADHLPPPVLHDGAD